MRPVKWFFGTAILTSAVACSNSSGPSGTGRQVAFQLATRPSAGATASGLAASTTGSEIVKLGSDSINFSQVQLVLRRIELTRASASACDTLAVTHDCEELETGPVLVDLPLGSGAQRQFTVAVDTGSYSKLELQIHRPESGSSADAAFLQANPGFLGVSIKAIGAYDGIPFTYTSDLDVGQEQTFSTPLVITDAAGAQLTLLVDLSKWFVNGGGTGLVDPATALIGQPNEGLVKSNIEASFHAFEDANQDGRDDHATF